MYTIYVTGYQKWLSPAWGGAQGSRQQQQQLS